MPVTTRLDTTGLRVNSLMRDLHGYRIAPHVVGAAEKVLVPRMRAALRKNNSVWRGTLLKSIGATMVAFETRRGEAAVKIGTIGVDYGRNIEEGTDPHVPDARKIRAWVREKLRPANPARTAALIMRSIQRKGTRARPFIKPVYDRAASYFRSSLTQRVRRHLMRGR